MQADGKQQRKGKFEKGRGGGGGGRRDEPKYNDTEEAKQQLEKIRRIEADMKQVQQKLGQLHSKGKELDRKVKLTMKDKSKAGDRVEGLVRRIEKLKSERISMSENLKKHQDLMEQRRQAETRAKQGLMRQRKKNQSDQEFVDSCLQAIEGRVKELNLDLENHSGSASEERQILKEIQRVRATKNQIGPYLQRSKQFQEARAAFKRAERDVESKTSFIATLEAELADLRAEVAALDGKEKAESEPVKEALSSEEEQLTDRLNELYADLRSTKDGLNENREKWYEARREKVRKKAEAAQQRRDEENARRDAERKAAALEERQEKKAVVPYAKEMRDCGALLAYLDGLVTPKDAGNATSSSAEPKESKPKESKPKESKPATQAPKPQAQKGPPAEEDDWGSFAQKKKKKGRNNKKKNKQKFSINLQSMDQFVQLGFPAPMTLEEVPSLREKVAAKLAEYQEKSDKERAALLAEIAKEEEEEARRTKEKAPAKAEPAAEPAAEAAETTEAAE